MFTASFWKDTGERAVRTFAQALLAALAAGLVLTDAAQWKAALITAAGATLGSVLTSLVATNVGDPESPAFSGGGMTRAVPVPGNYAGDDHGDW